jgi:nucleoside-diphosphate-sugar epimerase
VLNIGSGESASVNRIAELVGGPTAKEEARQEPRHSLASVWEAKRTLGWQPRISPEEGIRRLLESDQP